MLKNNRLVYMKKFVLQLISFATNFVCVDLNEKKYIFFFYKILNFENFICIAYVPFFLNF